MIKLYNIALILNYNLNLISLKLFKENGITFHINLIMIVLIKVKKIVAYI